MVMSITISMKIINIMAMVTINTIASTNAQASATATTDEEGIRPLKARPAWA